ncbi:MULTISPECIES: translocation/assembly module TamB domain-containing protein [unclassified Halanaerobium]|uniref:translocation/assembly module TamB domain-containing protein n=1 Tax=unclassified Halanaerobium TaxID=2641197 RepID=UPI000DF2A0AE|nr:MULTISPECIES: translocation/assembly module TamB domain-containing protein [unclassified Halanaerobium]RCW48248.1 translocation and assembly module TamB [Halanaerobium sp. MA284_MarDTE_T2]RCW85675.1 translocation and assembly module TamB [Halanaerobium sp. DL-01]
MDKRLKFLLGVLTVFIIAVYFLNIAVGVPQFLKEDIINFLEEIIGGEISVAEISFWPLTKINLTEVSFTDDFHNNIDIEEVNLIYHFNFFAGDKNWLELDLIKLKSPAVEINNLFFDKEIQKDQEIRDMEMVLPEFFSGLVVNISDGKLNSKLEDYQFKLNNFSLSLSAVQTTEFELNFNGTAEINYLNLGQKNKIKDLQLDELKASLDYRNGKLILAAESRNLPLHFLEDYINAEQLSYADYRVDLRSLNGTADINTFLEMKNLTVEEYAVEVNLNSASMSADIENSSPKAVLEQQKLDIEIPESKLAFSGPQLKSSMASTEVSVNGSIFTAAFDYMEESGYRLKLEAEDISPEDISNKYIKKGNFDISALLEGNREKLTSITADLKAEKFNILDKNIEKAAASIRMEEKVIYVDNFSAQISASAQISLQGNYSLNSGKYLVSSKADNIVLSDIPEGLQNYIPDNYKKQISGEKLNFDINVGGIYNGKNDLSAAGEVNLDFNLKNLNDSVKLSTSFWYKDSTIYLGKAAVDSSLGKLDIIGSIDFANKIFAIRYAGTQIDVSLLELSSLGVLPFDSRLSYVNGGISGKFKNPEISLQARMPFLEYQNYRIEEINLRTKYNEHRLNIEEFEMRVDDAKITGRGYIDKPLSESANQAAITLKTENLFYSSLSDFLKLDLPFSGELKAELNLSGNIRDPKVVFSINSENTILKTAEREFELKTLQAAVIRKNEKFNLNNLKVSDGNISLTASGNYNLNSGLDINFNIDNIVPADYLNIEGFSGVITADGNISGQISSPAVKFSLNSKEMEYYGLDLNIENSNFRYFKNSLYFDQFSFKAAEGNYNLEGKISKLLDLPELKLKLMVDSASVNSILSSFSLIDPFRDEILFNGEVDITGTVLEPEAAVNLDGNFSDSPKSKFSLNGNIDNNLEIYIKGHNIWLNYTDKRSAVKISAEGRADFEGQINGSIDYPLLRLEHNLDQLKINDTAIEKVEGEIVLENFSRVSARENISIKQGGNMYVDSTYMPKDNNLNTALEVEKFPLALIMSLFSQKYSTDGLIDGKVKISGDPLAPKMSGKLNVNGQKLDLNISDPIKNYSGNIEFKGDKIDISALNGRFGDGNFKISGFIKPFTGGNEAWNLNLNGKELYFDVGSLKGNFDADISMTGPLLNPLVSGDLKTYDFIVGIPFKWPHNSGSSGENNFEIRLDLNITPGKNVRVKNPNIDVTVAGGSLRLFLADGDLRMEGRLTAERGVFNYYGNRFELQSGTLTFTPFAEDDIPSLQILARTFAGRTEITVNLDGPVDNMRTTFSSSPELSQQEILNLLTSRGALGSAITGEEIEVQSVIRQELIRIVNSAFQTDVVDRLETDMESALSLDRLEINTYQYGLEREFAVYLGKNLSDKFYLEYASIFTEDEREREWSFQYLLTEKTKLKGSWLGDDEYRISIETGFEF